jgi:membrane AbrB-like protein
VATLAQAVLGVVIGAGLHTSTLREVGSHLAAVLLVVTATLGLSVAGGLVLARIAPVDQATASFGMIAGGASGIIAISRELGADERIVAVLQYLRVLVVVSAMPLVATAVFGLSASNPAAAAHHDRALPGIAFALLASLTGIPLARLLRLPAAALLGPMLVAAAFSLSGSGLAAPVPQRLLDAALAVIGLQVGLAFTLASLKRAGRIVPAAAAVTVTMIALCALLGLALASLAGVSKVDGYLATTPGGLNAVLALAVASPTNATFIVSVQLVRTFLMLLAAPPLARWLARSRAAAVEAPAR